MKTSICAKTFTLMDGECLDLSSFFDHFNIPQNKIDVSKLCIKFDTGGVWYENEEPEYYFTVSYDEDK